MTILEREIVSDTYHIKMVAPLAGKILVREIMFPTQLGQRERDCIQQIVMFCSTFKLF